MKRLTWGKKDAHNIDTCGCRYTRFSCVEVVNETSENMLKHNVAILLKLLLPFVFFITCGFNTYIIVSKILCFFSVLNSDFDQENLYYEERFLVRNYTLFNI